MNCSCMAIISIVRIGLAGGGGGVLRAVKSHLTCFRRSDLETDMEMLACLIYTRPAFCLLFSVFYRPPGQNLDFSAKFGAFPNNYSSTNISTLIVWEILIFLTLTGVLVHSMSLTQMQRTFVVWFKITFFFKLTLILLGIQLTQLTLEIFLIWFSRKIIIFCFWCLCSSWQF